MDLSKCSQETITSVHWWTPTLFSVRTTRPDSFAFIPGQFVRIGLPVTTAAGASEVWRPYSIVSGRNEDALEFYSVRVPDGEFSPALSQCAVGDALWVDKVAHGFLTTQDLVSGGDLWMLATGTGLAPFLSILAEEDTWQRYDRLILVHSVRLGAELGYREHLAALAQRPGLEALADTLHYVPVVTREVMAGALGQRIPELLETGQLAHRFDTPFEPGQSRVMVCGNPAMLKAVRTFLQVRGFAVSRNGVLGQLVTEKGW